MKSANILWACTFFGLAAFPLCAYSLRSADILTNTARDDWFLSVLRGKDPQALLIAFLCVIIGRIVGLWLQRVVQPVQRSGVSPTPLRTPIAAAILVPVAIATIDYVSKHLTQWWFGRSVWPPFYSEHWLLCSAVAACAGHASAKLLNTWERVFAQEPFSVQVEILLCSPLASCVSCFIIVGFFGSGLLGGRLVGQFCGCPIMGAWIGTCVAAITLLIERGILWPPYFSLDA